MQRTLIVGALVLVAGVSVGCGSGTGGGNTSDGGIPPGVGALTWKDGATAHSALGPAASRVLNAWLDMLQIAGGEAGGAAGISFAVSTAPPLLPGSYACSESATGGRIVSISYVAGTVASSGVPTCTIDLASIGNTTGTRVTGTFSAILTVGGTTKTISEGAFDLALTVSSL